MPLRNGEHGYGLVTKVLHWATVAAIVAQFAVGWTMSGDDPAADRADDRLAAVEERERAALEAAEDAFEERLERLEQQAEAQGEAAEEAFDDEAARLEEDFRAEQELAERRLEARLGSAEEVLDEAEEDVSTLHVVLGLTILGLGLARLLWRRATPLPPWAEHLGPGERQLESWLEKALLTLLLVVPATGLLLVAGDHDLLAVHVTAQVALLAVVAVHVGLVLKHTVVRRHRHLSRML